MEPFEISEKFADDMKARTENLKHRFDGLESVDDKFELVTQMITDLTSCVAQAIVQLEARNYTFAEYIATNLPSEGLEDS
jgi:ribosomal protein L16 Arg81 hydroxylase